MEKSLIDERDYHENTQNEVPVEFPPPGQVTAVLSAESLIPSGRGGGGTQLGVRLAEPEGSDAPH